MPCPVARASGDAGQQRERPEQRPGMDSHRRVLRQVAVPVVVVRRGHETGPGVERDAVRGQIPIRAGGAIARDGAEHDLRVHLAEPIEAQAALGEGAGTHRLDDGVSVADQVEVHLDALRSTEVEGDAALPAVDVQVQQRVAFDDRPGHAADVVALGRLDLDDVGAEVGEKGRELAGAEE